MWLYVLSCVSCVRMCVLLYVCFAHHTNTSSHREERKGICTRREYKKRKRRYTSLSLCMCVSVGEGVCVVFMYEYMCVDMNLTQYTHTIGKETEDSSLSLSPLQVPQSRSLTSIPTSSSSLSSIPNSPSSLSSSSPTSSPPSSPTARDNTQLDRGEGEDKSKMRKPISEDPILSSRGAYLISLFLSVCLTLAPFFLSSSLLPLSSRSDETEKDKKEEE